MARNDSREALAIAEALKPMVMSWIKSATRDCVRRRKMTVTTAPSGGQIGVTEAYGEEILIPYVSTLANVTVGTSVWVEWVYSASNMVAVSRGTGT